jgi:hypothetical protein
MSYRSFAGRVWRDPVWSKVISTAIVGAAMLVGSKWATLERSGRNMLEYTVVLPAWLLAVGMVCLLGSSVLLAIVLNRRSLAEEAALQEPNAVPIEHVRVIELAE